MKFSFLETKHSLEEMIIKYMSYSIRKIKHTVLKIMKKQSKSLIKNFSIKLKTKTKAKILPNDSSYMYKIYTGYK